MELINDFFKARTYLLKYFFWGLTFFNFQKIKPGGKLQNFPKREILHIALHTDIGIKVLFWEMCRVFFIGFKNFPKNFSLRKIQKLRIQMLNVKTNKYFDSLRVSFQYIHSIICK